MIAVLVAASLPLIAKLSPAAAQAASSNGQTQTGQAGESTSTPAPTTGVFCAEEMTATFCNVVTGPNTNGYGRSTAPSSSGTAAANGAGSLSASSSTTGAGGNTSSIPPCPSEPPFDELCN
jgi:hypothetical protein